MARYTLHENNSGGRWWLDKSDYEALFAAGWTYERPEDFGFGSPDEPFCGGDAPYGWRSNTSLEAGSLQEAVESFESVTGQDFFAEGCNCCGAPFSLTSDGEYVSGDSVERRTVRPW